MNNLRALLLAGVVVTAFHAVDAAAQPSQDAATSQQQARNSRVLPEAPTLKCPKCQGDMEPGYILDVQGSASNTKDAAEWIQGPPQRSFWTGVVLRGRTRSPIQAYHCKSCGYLELYAK